MNAIDRRGFCSLAALPIVAPLAEAFRSPDFVVRDGERCFVGESDPPAFIVVQGGGTLEAASEATIDRLDLEPGANCEWQARYEGDTICVAKVLDLRGLENEASIMQDFTDGHPWTPEELAATVAAQRQGILVKPPCPA